MTQPSQSRSVQLWLFTGLTVVVAFWGTSVNLIEWYKVRVQGNTEGYPFGGEGPVPEYYSSAERYANTMLGWSLPFALLMIAALWAFFRRKDQNAMVCFGLTALTWIFMFIRGVST